MSQLRRTDGRTDGRTEQRSCRVGSPAASRRPPMRCVRFTRRRSAPPASTATARAESSDGPRTVQVGGVTSRAPSAAALGWLIRSARSHARRSQCLLMTAIS